MSCRADNIKYEGGCSCGCGSVCKCTGGCGCTGGYNSVYGGGKKANIVMVIAVCVIIVMIGLLASDNIPLWAGISVITAAAISIPIAYQIGRLGDPKYDPYESVKGGIQVSDL